MIRSPRFYVSASYFMLFFCVGSFMPFLSLFLRNHGWSGVQLGLYASIGPLIALATQPLWGLLCDTLGDTKKVYAALLVGVIASALVFAFLPATGIFFLLAALLGLLQSPLMPLLDTMALKTLDAGRSELGAMRLWGSFSFAVVSSIMGAVFVMYERSIFLVFALGAAIAIYFARHLEGGAPPETSAARARLTWTSLRGVLNRPLIVFLGLVFLLQLGHGMALSFLSIVMAERGASSTIIGYTWSITALIEIPVFFLLGRLLRRISPVLVLALGGFITTVRLACFVAAPTPLLMLLAQNIDGIAFPLLLIPGVLIVHELVPPRWQTTGQTIYAAVGSTLPRVIGGVWGGRIIDLFGGLALFTLCGVLTLTAACALVLYNRDFQKERRRVLAVEPAAP